MFYGSLDNDKLLRPLRKYYSADGSMEIKHNIATGDLEFVTYIGGDGYTAPIVLKSDGTTQNYLYLQRDYQGSIVAISDGTGQVLEKRLFDAWGNVLVQDGAGNALSGLTVLDRGYTGHEHLQSVGLIHMNGRLYDPKLHRFLQPDNYVQDPTNTQNYNRYGYVLNNPLKYSDPSGEKLTPIEECKQCGNTNYYSSDQQQANGEAIKALYDELSPWLEKNFSARNFKRAWDATGKAFEDANNFIGRNTRSFFRDVGRLFGGGRSSGPPPNMASYANIQMPTEHNSFGFNWTYLSQSNAPFNQMIYGAANSINIPIQYMMGRGVGDGSMRNLDGSSTSTDEGIIAFGTLPLTLSGGEGAASMLGNVKIPVYRVYGGGSTMFGKSYTIFNPKYVPFYRNFAGLPANNSGQFLLRGRIPVKNLNIGRWFAAPLDGNIGGLPFEFYQNYNQLSNPFIQLLKKPL